MEGEEVVGAEVSENNNTVIVVFLILSDSVSYCYLRPFSPIPDLTVTVAVLVGFCDLSYFVTIWSLSHGSHTIH